MLETGTIRQGLCEISAEDVHHIQQVATVFPKFNRQALAQTLREHLTD